MRNRSCTKSLAEVTDVGTQCRPQTKQNGKHCRDCCSENNSYHLGRRLGILTEDVVDLRFSRIAEWCLRNRERYIGITSYSEIKDLLLVRRGRSECSNDNRGGNWLRGDEELVGQILLCLMFMSTPAGPIGQSTHQRNLSFTTLLHTKHKRLF